MDTTRLRVFREVTRQGSFTAAADVLHISQPAVSQHVAKLEQELGCRLLERSSRRVRPTLAGEVFLRHVESLLAGLDDARRELAALTRSDCGQLRLTAFPSAVATFVPSAMGAFRAAFPKVRTALTEADPPIALARLLAGDTDLAVVYDYPLVGAPVDPRFDQSLIVADSMAVAVRADSAFAAHVWSARPGRRSGARAVRRSRVWRVAPICSHPDAGANPRIRSNPYTTSLDATVGPEPQRVGREIRCAKVPFLSPNWVDVGSRGFEVLLKGAQGPNRGHKERHGSTRTVQSRHRLMQLTCENAMDRR
ncbi:LysR family transcriptional regulator [Streptomyces sp. R39]|uniref:LysR family transcriptional regulator n=1 Tax=Streptomyces sp. R39 TaxID=3238631 RepID=A0AB39QMJ6_9ACTN